MYKRQGINVVLIPLENEKELVEIPDNIKAKLEIIPVRWIDEVLEVALVRQPTPLPEDTEVTPETAKVKDKDKKSSGVRAH